MSAEPIVLLGGGGHALDFANAIERSLGWDSIAGYLDDQPSDRMAGWDIPHLGELSTADIFGKRIFLAIGFPAARQAVLQKFDGQDFVSVMVVDPDCTVGRNVSIAAGSPVLAGARLSSNDVGLYRRCDTIGPALGTQIGLVSPLGQRFVAHRSRQVARHQHGRTGVNKQKLQRAVSANLPVVHFAADSALWLLSVPFAVWLRYDFDASEIGAGTLRAIAAAIGLQAIVGIALGQYRSKWRYGTFDEVRVVAGTAAIAGLVLTAMFWRDMTVPRSVPFLAMGISLLGQVAVRSVWRLYKSQRAGIAPEGARRVVVVGAGEGAEQILRTLTSSMDSPFVPVAMVDDDPLKRQLRLSGVRVRGRLSNLVDLADQERADAVLIAIPSAETSLLRMITADAEGAALEVFVLPRSNSSLVASALARSDRFVTRTCLAALPPQSTPLPSPAT